MTKTSLYENKYLENYLEIKRKLFRILPNIFEENFYYNLTHVLILFILQNYILTTILQTSYQVWDVVTPWLLVQFVKQSLYKGLALSLFASVLLESSGSVSAGFYIFLFWIVCSLINYFKDNISWRSYVSWKYTLLASLLVSFIYEIFYIVLLGSSPILGNEYFLFTGMRLLISSILGLLLIRLMMAYSHSYFGDQK